ncbi:hypothetical protein [Pseudodesulfovibrio sp.]|uniref:hypothetical protein n=1 Tax=unclassified Pseudodesulfovibrio TaxID=2661612 RepID=UPI003B009129
MSLFNYRLLMAAAMGANVYTGAEAGGVYCNGVQLPEWDAETVWYGLAVDLDGSLLGVCGDGDIYRDGVAMGWTTRRYRGVHVDPDGNIWAAIYNDTSNPGPTVGDIACNNVMQGWPNTTFRRVAISPIDGAVWAIADQWVYKDKVAQSDWPNTSYCNYYGLAINPDGAVWAIPTSKGVYADAVLQANWYRYKDIAFDKQGHLWGAASGNGGEDIDIYRDNIPQNFGLDGCYSIAVQMY